MTLRTTVAKLDSIARQMRILVTELRDQHNATTDPQERAILHRLGLVASECSAAILETPRPVITN
ncbi:MAG TPA: hypothetical protein VH558_02270 [Pseudolabrys sp.]|jgi:hypothetical protein